MREFTVTAMKHGLECRIKKALSLGEAIEFGRLYHQRTGVAVKVYDGNLELIREFDDYSPI